MKEAAPASAQESPVTVTSSRWISVTLTTRCTPRRPKGPTASSRSPVDDVPPPPRAAAGLFAEAIKPLAADLVLVGVQAHDELDGGVAPFLAAALGLALRRRDPRREGGTRAGVVTVCKEFPGAVMARMKVKLPAVLGILGADQPPRYVPVSRIRSAMKSTQFEELEMSRCGRSRGSRICRLYPPAAGEPRRNALRLGV